MATTREDTDMARAATLSVPEAARLLGIGRNSAYDAVARGEIPSIRIGKRILVPRKRLESMLAGERYGP
jgi:excisionase family DNA binding protein